MKGLFRSAVMAIIFAGAVLAIWKIFGGNPGTFINTIGGFLWLAVEGISNFFVQVFHAVSGGKK